MLRRRIFVPAVPVRLLLTNITNIQLFSRNILHTTNEQPNLCLSLSLQTNVRIDLKSNVIYAPPNRKPFATVCRVVLIVLLSSTV